MEALSSNTQNSYLIVLDQDEVIENQNSYEIASVLSSNTSLTSVLASYPSAAPEVTEPVSQFPDIEKCIPRWKQVFPWVCWCSEDNVLYCLQCRELLKKHFPDKVKKSNVILITSSEKIFTVAKALRGHHDSASHMATVYLFSYSNLVYLVSFFNLYYKDLKEEIDVMEVVRSLFNYSELKRESLVSTLKNIATITERALVESLKKSTYFSVVADQCRGILILRWIDDGQIVEHVFWSYLIEYKMTPMQYLRRFGLSFDKMTLYIANSLCQHCQRCQNLSVMQASLPPRLPSTISFANILWNLDLLRPLSALMSTIHKLFVTFPYKFAKKFESQELKNLLQYSVKPYCLIKIMDSFEDIRKIAEEVYESRFYVEALGLSVVELKADIQHKKILILLQEIIDTVREAGMGHKITDTHIVKLNQALGSLKTWSSGANFVIYKNQATDNAVPNSIKREKVFDFLYFVEKFIDENQKSIYYNGREQVRSFVSICCTKALVNRAGDQVEYAILFEHFNVVYNVYTQILKNSVDIGKMKIFKCVKNFHNYVLQNNVCIKSCIDIIRFFHKSEQHKTTFPDAYELFLFCATMPFQPCHVARSLFVSFVIEQRLESSVWTKIDLDLKPWLLYLHHELSFLPMERVLTWWLDGL